LAALAPSMPPTNHDETYMRAALDEARRAADAADVPVGAVVVADGAIVATGRNRREAAGDPTAHAEIEALRAAARAIGHWRDGGAPSLAHEPRPLCARALARARARRPRYTAPRP